jgi:hypothetical protein
MDVPAKITELLGCTDDFYALEAGAIVEKVLCCSCCPVGISNSYAQKKKHIQEALFDDEIK